MKAYFVYNSSSNFSCVLCADLGPTDSLMSLVNVDTDSGNSTFCPPFSREPAFFFIIVNSTIPEKSRVCLTQLRILRHLDHVSISN